MRKIILRVCLGVLAVIFYSGYVHAEGAPLDQQRVAGKFKNISTLMVDKCMACHSKNYELPFYAKIPGIRQMIEQDYRDGLRAMDINQELSDTHSGKPISETMLSKMEWVINNNTMPPAKFTAVHWGSKLSDQERKEILDWIRDSRAQYYATGLAAPEMANEPLQPLPKNLKVNAAKVAIGQKLFNDKRLSADDTLACSGCHFANKAGTDNSRFAEGIRKQYGDINAPTTYNAVFNMRQFWDGRAANLQEQAGGPPLNPIEMGSKNWDQIITKLAKDEPLTAEMKAVYREGWTEKNITDAIAEYEKTLITPNSRFDKFLMGDQAALNEQEKEGYQLFKAYRCASCHVGKSVGGQSFEYMDLKGDYFKDRGNPLGSDKGLMGFTGNKADLHKFKTPNLRNVELTHPYLHDGTVQTLDDAVRIMGKYLSGIPIADGDRAKIVAFLRTLTGEYQGKPVAGTPVAQ